MKIKIQIKQIIKIKHIKQFKLISNYIENKLSLKSLSKLLLPNCAFFICVTIIGLQLKVHSRIQCLMVLVIYARGQYTETMFTQLWFAV